MIKYICLFVCMSFCFYIMINKKYLNNTKNFTLLLVCFGVLFSCSQVDIKDMFGFIKLNKADREVTIYDKALPNDKSNFKEYKYTKHYSPMRIKPYLIAIYVIGFLTNTTSAQTATPTMSPTYKCFQNRTDLKAAVDTYIDEGGASPQGQLMLIKETLFFLHYYLIILLTELSFFFY